MARIAPLAPPYPVEVQAHFDRVMPEGVPPLTLFRTVATSARAWQKFRAGSLLDGNVLPLRERELIIDRTCALAGCEYEWGVHVAAFAHAAQLTAEEVQATCRDVCDAASFSARERALLAAADALHARAALSEGEFADLRAHLSDVQILELLMLCGFYRTVAYLANGLNLPLEDFAARFPEQAP